MYTCTEDVLRVQRHFCKGVIYFTLFYLGDIGLQNCLRSTVSHFFKMYVYHTPHLSFKLIPPQWSFGLLSNLSTVSFCPSGNLNSVDRFQGFVFVWLYLFFSFISLYNTHGWVHPVFIFDILFLIFLSTWFPPVLSMLSLKERFHIFLGLSIHSLNINNTKYFTLAEPEC